MSTQQKGFTLLEMTIVIAVIALIVGGIVMGRTMIRTSQLNAVVNEAQKYTQAIGAFREKYNALPGDFAGATTIWGTAGGCANGTGTQTCNGDGDGLIAEIAGNYYTEQFYAWQHLANANMVEGRFTGVVGSPKQRVPGTNVPTSQLADAGWGLTDAALPLANTYIEYAVGDVYPRTVLWLGGAYTDAGSEEGRMAPVLQPGEAWQIDRKIDDGYPEYGKVLAIDTDSCYTSPNFNISVTTRICALAFKTGF